MWKTHKFFQKTQKTQNNNKNSIHMRTTVKKTRFLLERRLKTIEMRDLAFRLYMQSSKFSLLERREIFYGLS